MKFACTIRVLLYFLELDLNLTQDGCQFFAKQRVSQLWFEEVYVSFVCFMCCFSQCLIPLGVGMRHWKNYASYTYHSTCNLNPTTLLGEQFFLPSKFFKVKLPFDGDTIW
jgi:hypothetical protein